MHVAGSSPSVAMSRSSGWCDRQGLLCAGLQLCYGCGWEWVAVDAISESCVLGRAVPLVPIYCLPVGSSGYDRHTGTEEGVVHTKEWLQGACVWPAPEIGH